MNPFDVTEIFTQIGDFFGGISGVFGGLVKALDVVFGWAGFEKPAE